jgi:hypothetical protein
LLTRAEPLSRRQRTFARCVRCGGLRGTPEDGSANGSAPLRPASSSRWSKPSPAVRAGYGAVERGSPAKARVDAEPAGDVNRGMSEKAAFQQWQSAKAFEANWRDATANRNSAELFGAKLSWFRDVYCAKKCASLMGVRRLRLSPQDEKSADFEVQLRNGEVLPFQTTVADSEGRKIGLEYQDWRDEGYPPSHDSGEDWWRRRLEIAPALLRAVAKKAPKPSRRYSPDMRLLIYLNLGTYDSWREEIELEIATCAAPAALWFRSVWVLWSGRLYRCAPNSFLGLNSTLPACSLRPRSMVCLGSWRERCPLGSLLHADGF